MGQSSDIFTQVKQFFFREARMQPSLTATSAAAASDPLLRAVNASTAIVTAGNGAITVTGIACDGNGQPLASAVVRIDISGAAVTGLIAQAATTGTNVGAYNGQGDNANANSGGVYFIQATAAGLFAVTFTCANATAYRVNVTHLGRTVSAAVTTT